MEVIALKQTKAKAKIKSAIFGGRLILASTIPYNKDATLFCAWEMYVGKGQQLKKNESPHVHRWYQVIRKTVKIKKYTTKDIGMEFSFEICDMIVLKSGKKTLRRNMKSRKH